MIKNTPMWHVTVLTLFPEMFPGYLGCSLAGRGLKEGIWQLDVVDIKDYGLGKHKQVDDTPFGGGAGMVLRPDVLGEAIEKGVLNKYPKRPKLLYMTPRGKVLTQAKALEFTKEKNVAIVCGRFEGLDERVIEEYDIEEVSIGDYVLSGGEVAALTLMDACVRLLPGVMGAEETLHEESFSAESGYEYLLEYPHYTRPSEWKGHEVPDVLRSGNHKAISDWRLEKAQDATKTRRKDLWEQYVAMYLRDNKKGN